MGIRKGRREAYENLSISEEGDCPRCGGEKQPWCYIEGGDERVKYGICTDLPKCQCGSTGLTYTDPLGEKYDIPANLQNLKGDKHADDFAELIDNWNANKPFEASE